ncbi:hypothetical protein [Tepidibacillus decaturensis]|uniref:Uncharacterized protein n=1 Tax=Tepidibacillus decaturensis TaxID=1413211 RepID=A0A135L0Y1_9BACI|nr:hypothetical protein [Tepidibacillus decaturensis]KXG42656.1 hypothetical protein U473_00290 [Tepidibacillus decaturensis]
MTEQEFITNIRTAIKASVDDTELQKKRQLEQQQKTLQESVQQLQAELNTLIKNHDYENAMTKESELKDAQKQLKMVNDVLNTYGDDVNLYAIDYDALDDIQRQVNSHYKAQLKAKCEELKALLVQADSIKSDIMKINGAANQLIHAILAAKKDNTTPRTALNWDFMTKDTEEAKALNKLHEFTKRF